MKKLLLIIFFSFSLKTYAQSPKDVNIADLVQEIQQIKKDDRRMQLIFWLPTDYWEVSFSQLSNVSPEIASQIQESLKDYFIICVGDMKINGTAGFVYKSKEEISTDLRIIDSANKSYYPLQESELSAEVLRISEIIKPLFAKTLGQIGSGLSFFYFRIKDSNGVNIFNAKKKQFFKVYQGGNTFVWSLPLSSLLPPKFCPIDNQLMNSKWEYCPFHGIKLSN